MRIYVTVLQEYRDLGMKSELSVAVCTFVTPTTLGYVRLVFQRCPFFSHKESSSSVALNSSLVS